MSRYIRIFSILMIFLFVGQSFAVGQDQVMVPVPTPVEWKIGFKADPCIHSSGVGKILFLKTAEIIGRTGSGMENAPYMIVPSIEVEDVRHTSGGAKSVTAVKGSLTLNAVSALNRDMVWHSASFPLKAVLGSDREDPAEALAKKISITDPKFVRFVNVAREKISKETTKEPTDP